MLVDDGARDALKRYRMLVGAVRAPQLRQDLATTLAGETAPSSPQVEALGWFDDDQIDHARLTADYATLALLLSEAGILAYGPISEWPAREQDRVVLTHALIDRVFLGESRGWMTEVELNARLAILFFDPSGLRRYAVDNGMLTREPDGSRYWQVDQAGEAAVATGR